jgi:acyl-CoA synthetase (AMP-forming)/AMP-acid ligase II
MDRRIIGVVATDGGEMAEMLFAIEGEGAVSVLLRSADDRERIEALGIAEIRHPNRTSGWMRPAPLQAADDDAPVRIVYSSGTTGQPKAILLNHGNIGSTTERLVAEMSMTAEVREYIGVPLTYSFGLARARAVAAVGGAYYVPPNGFDPLEIAAMLRAGEINAISAVPTLWRVLIANGEIIGTSGAAVRWIEIGSQAMSVDEKREMRRLFPNARIIQHYGLTEASRATFLAIDSCGDAEMLSVGRCTSGTEAAIDESGLIRVRGPHVARWRLEGGQWQPLVDSDGWLTTGDLGRIEDGFLHFEGRTDDLINCGGIKVSPDQIEQALVQAMELDPEAANAIAVARTPDPQRGDGVLVAYEKGASIDPEALRISVGQALAAHGLTVGAALKIVEVETLPRTETGKVLRRELGNVHGHEAGREESQQDAPATSVGDHTRERLLALWRNALEREDVDPDKSFYDVGGDSLSAISLALAMEKAGFDPETSRLIFEGQTISEIARATAARHAPLEEEVESLSLADPIPEQVRTTINPVASLSEGLNLVKGWLIICMVTSHWLPTYLDKVNLRDSLFHRALQPFLSMGSPTLSYCFGIGASVFFARQYRASRPSFHRSVQFGSIMLIFGLLAGAALEVVSRMVSGAPAEVAATVAGGPFPYFLLATLSLPLWIGRIRNDLRSMLALFASAMVAMLLFELARRAINPASPVLANQGLQRLLVGHWNLPQMASFSLAGAATGVLIEMMIARQKPLSLLAPVGLLLIPAGAMMALAGGELEGWFSPHKHIHTFAVISYIGITLFVIGRIEQWRAAVANRPRLRSLMETLLTCGILLFPLFIVQSLVFHGADVIAATTGIGLLTALSMLIALWLIVAAYMVYRMRRLYYGSSKLVRKTRRTAVKGCLDPSFERV